jgi:MFS transporter, FSR family, fosmidomycin resistance protein
VSSAAWRATLRAALPFPLLSAAQELVTLPLGLLRFVFQGWLSGTIRSRSRIASCYQGIPFRSSLRVGIVPSAMSPAFPNASRNPAQTALPFAVPPRNGGSRVVWFVGVSHAANHFVMLIFPAVLLLVQREFGLGYARLGILANVALLCYGIGALPAGMLADRLGGERLLVAWLLGGSLACLGIGLSRGPVSLGVGLAVLGLFASLHHPAGSGILVALRNLRDLDVGRAFGRVGVMGNVGLAASPVVAGAVGAGWGWRTAFLVGAIPGLLLSLAVWRYGLPLPNRLPTQTAHAEPPPTFWRELTFPLLLLFAVETLMGFVFQGVSTFLPAHLAGRAGIAGLTAAQVARGGSLASLALLFGGLGHVLGGRLMAAHRREAIFLIATAMTTLCLFGMGAAVGFSLVIFSTAFAFTHFAMSTMSNTFIASHTPTSLGGTAFGITFTLSIGVGSLASSTMGAVGERLGLSTTFLALGVTAAVGVALVVWFGSVVGAWSAAGSPSTPPLLTSSHPRGR